MGQRTLYVKVRTPTPGSEHRDGEHPRVGPQLEERQRRVEGAAHRVAVDTLDHVVVHETEATKKVVRVHRRQTVDPAEATHSRLIASDQLRGIGDERPNEVQLDVPLVGARRLDLGFAMQLRGRRVEGSWGELG